MPAVQEIERVLYNPYPHQLKLHRSEARFKYNMEPVRSGKGIWLVNESTMNLVKNMEMFSQRPETMVPKWNIWNCGDTTDLLMQLYRDTLAYTPRELFDGEPLRGLAQSNTVIKLINGAQITFKSTRRGVAESQLVGQGVDRANITEAGQMTSMAWQLIQSRLSSPDRFQTSTAAAEGTPRGQVDPDDPTKEQWFWAEIQQARKPGANKKLAEALYWFEDRNLPELGGGTLDHPILSLTPEGREELRRQKNNPNLSELKYREDYMGECLPTVMGKAVIVGFIPSLHISEKAQYSPRFELYRVWDFSRNYPAITFHQIYADGTWAVIDEYIPINQDLIDVDLADKVEEWTNHNHYDVDKKRIFDWGDFEGNQETDQRRDTTVEALRKKGINMQTNPTKQGDESLAIDTINARMKIRQDGTPNFIINPRCQLSIKALGGMWIYKVVKHAGIEAYRPYVEEIHPWIDDFDTFKMFVVNVLLSRGVPNTGQGRRVRTVRGEQNEPIGYETY